MRFWDSSAVVPLLVAERRSERLLELRRLDAEIVAWWATQVESASAVERLARASELTPDDASVARARLETLRRAWNEVAPGEAIRESALRLLRRSPLRAADALQLAAAIEASEGEPRSLPFVTLDDRLRDAAELEGFTTLPVRA